MATWNAQAYLDKNPDVMSGWASANKTPNWTAIVGGTTPNDYALWHWNNYGKNEGRTWDDPTPATPTGVDNTWLNQQNADRQAKADQYNQQASAWNTQAQGALSGLNSLWGQISNYKLGDDLSGLGALQQKANAFTSQLQGLRYSAPTALNLSPLASYNGQQYYLDTPQTNNVDLGMLNTTLGSDINNFIRGLQLEDKMERSRVDSYYKNLISNFNRQDVAYKGGSLDRDWDMEKEIVGLDWQDAQNFDTALGSYNQEWQGKAQNEYNQLLDILNGRATAKTAEQTRISDFETQMRAALQGLQGTFDGLTIRDVADPSGYKNQLRDLQSQLSGFRSQLDLSQLDDEINDVGGYQNQLSNLIADRTMEQSRLRDIQNQYRSQAYGINSDTRFADQYNLNNLLGLEDAIQQLRDGMGAETSQLDFDWTQQNSLLDQALANISGLKANRATGLAKERSDVEALAAQLGGVQLQDETKWNQLRTALQREYGDLNRYQGGIDDQMGFLEDTQQSVEDKLNELQSKRSGLEGTAQQLLSRIKRSPFYSLGDVDAINNEALSLEEQLQLFGAQQGYDEYDEIERLLGIQRSRIQADQKTVADRDAAAAAATKKNLDAYGNLVGNSVLQDGTLTEAQLLALLSGQDDDQRVPVSYSSSFSSNLGL